MWCFRRNSAPEAALVQQLTEQLKEAEEQKCTLQKELQKEREERSALQTALQEELQKEREERSALQTALQEAVDTTRSVQERMDLKTIDSQILTEALREKEEDLKTANAHNQRLEEESTLMLASISRMESEKEMSQMLRDALKNNYVQLRVTCTSLEEKLSTAKDNLEEQKLAMRRALDQKEEETTALQKELCEEKERSAGLQEEVKQLLEEVRHLTSSAEEEKVHAQLNMDELKNNISTLQKELSEEQYKNKEQVEAVMSACREFHHAVEKMMLETKNLLQENQSLKTSAHEDKVHAKKQMEDLRKENETLQKCLQEEKELNLELQSDVGKLRDEKQALMTEHEKASEHAKSEAEKNMVAFRKELHILQTELRAEHARRKHLEEHICELQKNKQALMKSAEETRVQLQQNLKEKAALQHELTEKKRRNQVLQKDVHQLENQMRQHQGEIWSLKAALEQQTKHVTEPGPMFKRTNRSRQRPDQAPVTTTNLEKASTKSKASRAVSHEIQTEDGPNFTRRSRIVLNT